MSTLALRYLAPLALLLVAASGNAGAGAIARTELSGSGPPSFVEFVQEKRQFVQEKRKSEKESSPTPPATSSSRSSSRRTP